MLKKDVDEKNEFLDLFNDLMQAFGKPESDRKCIEFFENPDLSIKGTFWKSAEAGAEAVSSFKKSVLILIGMDSIFIIEYSLLALWYTNIIKI